MNNQEHRAAGFRAPLVAAVLLQLGDEGDQVLEAEDEAAVLALMQHAVLPVMAARGVGEVNHVHVHLGPSGVGHAARRVSLGTRHTTTPR